MKIAAFFVLLLFLFGCTQSGSTGEDSNGTVPQGGLDEMAKKIVEKGDTVSVDYKGTLEDGTEFDSSLKPGREPLEFTVGAGQMIKGFDNAVVGMKEGDEKTVTLKPVDAYGEKNADLVRFVPKEQLGSIFDEIEEGSMLTVSTGQQVKVVEKTEEGAKIDFNHELAGKTLVFWIKIVAINKG